MIRQELEPGDNADDAMTIREAADSASGRSDEPRVNSTDFAQALHADEVLRNAQNLNTLILNSSRDCIVVLDLDAHTQYVSPGGIESMEISDVDAILGLSWLRVWKDGDHASAGHAVAEARAGRVGRFQGFCPTHKGTPKWWDVVISSLPGPDGKPELLVSIGRDITELRQTEERLALALGASSMLGIWDWDLATDRIYSEANFARMFGVEPARAVEGAPVEAFIAGMHREDRGRIDAAIKRAMTTMLEYDEEFRVIGSDGQQRWVSARGRCRADEEGRPSHFPGVAIDITARKSFELALADSRTRLQGITDSIDQMIWSTTPDGFHDFFNRRWYEYTGVPADSIDGEAWNALLHRDDRQRTRERWRRSLETGEPYRIEFRLKHRSGQYRWVLARAQAVRDGADSITRWYGTCTDIEEIVEARDVLARSREELEHMVGQRTAELMAVEDQLRQSQKMDAVGQLTGGLAHDFNNLLIGITGSLEMLQRRVAQGRVSEVDRYINAAQGAARRAASLTHRLLAFSRRQTLDPKPTDIDRLIRGMEELIRRTVGPAIEIEVVGAVGLWTTLVDPNQLENALLNLCINARDAMPDGGRLTIETANKWLDERAARERELPPGQFLSLCVTDTGTGMTPEIVARAFDPFFTTKPIGMGTGLGLSMVYGFARQSGGQVRIYSEVGKGTTMCLYLPRDHGSESREETAEPHHAARAEQGQTVLIVDDESTVRMLVTEVLEELGYATLEASEGASGLAVLRSDVRIDLLITDVGLPGGMNGRQVADGGRGVRPGLKVLFITGYAENAVVGNGHLDPGMQVLTKPFTMDALANRVKDLIGRA